jgi:hypothetical protein
MRSLYIPIQARGKILFKSGEIRRDANLGSAASGMRPDRPRFGQYFFEGRACWGGAFCLLLLAVEKK